MKTIDSQVEFRKKKNAVYNRFYRQLTTKPSVTCAIGVQSMHMTKNISEGKNETSFWSTCLMLVAVFAIADALTGGLLRETVTLGAVEYAVAFAFVIATVGVYASDGSPGLRFIRSCSRHKL